MPKTHQKWPFLVILDPLCGFFHLKVYSGVGGPLQGLPSPRSRAWVARNIVWNTSAHFTATYHTWGRAHLGAPKPTFRAICRFFSQKRGIFRPKNGLFRQVGPCKRTGGCTWWAQLPPCIGEHGPGGLVYHLWHTKVAKDPRDGLGTFFDQSEISFHFIWRDFSSFHLIWRVREPARSNGSLRIPAR